MSIRFEEAIRNTLHVPFPSLHPLACVEHVEVTKTLSSIEPCNFLCIKWQPEFKNQVFNRRYRKEKED
jgi:hypothetical protein